MAGARGANLAHALDGGLSSRFILHVLGPPPVMCIVDSRPTTRLTNRHGGSRWSAMRIREPGETPEREAR